MSNRQLHGGYHSTVHKMGRFVLTHQKVAEVSFFGCRESLPVNSYAFNGAGGGKKPAALLAKTITFPSQEGVVFAHRCPLCGMFATWNTKHIQLGRSLFL